MNNKTPRWRDWALLAAERMGRQIYWNMPWLRKWVKRRRKSVQPSPQIADRRQFREYLRSVGVVEGALVMAHTSVSGLHFTDEKNPAASTDSIKTAKLLVDDLLELIGPGGTLVMPTHAVYQTADADSSCGKAGREIVYDPDATPSGVGLANELFRRMPGVQRSLFPYNMLSARGPLASELFRDNLNDRKPLPHGVDSAYYRFCQRNGLVISIGVPLGRYLTLIHVAEEVRDRDWPIKDFFEEREYVVQTGGERKTWIVRQRRNEYGMFSLCMRKLSRDLRGEGILHEGRVGSVRVDWCRAGDVFEFMMAKNSNSPYPYYLPWLARR